MESFNTELKIGMQAMIVGCTHPENTHLIGKMVTVEAFVEAGQLIPRQYTTIDVGADSSCSYQRSIVSGVNTTRILIANHASLNSKHLMPLPPLDDENFEESKSIEIKETAKC